MISRLSFGSLLLSAMLSFAVTVIPGGYIATEYFNPEAQATRSSEVYFQFRRIKNLVVTPDSSGKLVIELSSMPVGHYQDSMDFTLYNLDGSILKQGRINVGEKTTIHQNGLARGAYRLYVNSGQNGGRIATPGCGCCAEASSEEKLSMINHCPKLYFLTTGSVLKIHASGVSPDEHIGLTVWDDEGKVIYQGKTTQNGKKNPFILLPEIPIPDRNIGKVWSMKIDPVPGMGFEDMTLALLDGANPIVSFDPACLLFPIFTMANMNLEQNSTSFGFSICPLVREIPGAKVQMTFYSADDTTPFRFSSAWTPAVHSLRIDIKLPYSTVFQGFLNLSLTNSAGDFLYQDNHPMTICEGVGYKEIIMQEPGQPAAPTAMEHTRGFQLWQRQEPGFVRWMSRPAANEICSILKAETCPGLISSEFFALQPLRDFSQASLKISALTGPDGSTIPAKDVSLLNARIWAQKTDWQSTTYINAPELLEPMERLQLKKNRPNLFCIRVQVPEGTRPGVYSGIVSFNGMECLPYELTILDFKLPEYDDMTFGLYADGNRWRRQNYTDEELLREFKLFRDYGITSLMVYPLTGSTIAFDFNSNTWNVNLDFFRHQMKLYVQSGFKGVLVLSLQSLNSTIRAALNNKVQNHTPLFDSGYYAVMEAIRKIAEEDGWPEYCLHTVDEPHDGHQAEEAVKTLNLIHKAGFKTFNTCFGPFVRQYLSDCLDYRCYCQVGFNTSPTQQLNDEYRRESIEHNAQFWWYGSGCYTNCGLMQDCNIYSNRHMLGIFNFRSQATGAWSWTFLRSSGDVFNDFDRHGSSLAKDACICYPARKGNALILTLQWEACREGIYDYRFLRLWQEMVAQAKTIPAKVALANASEKRINAVLNAISWTCLNHSVSNGQLREMRTALIREINLLK